jgi:hypothetical protein
MLSVGLDLHKRYSQVEAVEENGDRRSGARLINEFEQIEGFFRSLGEPCRVVLEAGWNWEVGATEIDYAKPQVQGSVGYNDQWSSFAFLRSFSVVGAPGRSA